MYVKTDPSSYVFLFKTSKIAKFFLGGRGPHGPDLPWPFMRKFNSLHCYQERKVRKRIEITSCLRNKMFYIKYQTRFSSFRTQLKQFKILTVKLTCTASPRV